MAKTKILDVTLRDGGCVNDFNFGQIYMEKILSSLELSGVDIIELGYIDEKKGTSYDRTQYCDETVIPKCLLKSKKPGVTYVAMMDYGKFDVSKLHPRSEDGIDGIRMAFHKKDWRNMIAVGRQIMDKGYKFYVQPMITLRYTDSELIEMIESVNHDLPDASGFYLVDSFGEMRSDDVTRMLYLIDSNVKKDMPIGFHSHNNLQLSYSNAMAFLSFSTNREKMLDSSVMGMGKGAGNLNTELIMAHMNSYYSSQYKVTPLLELIDQVIGVIHKDIYWGYSVEYYLSSISHCTPSYAAYFYNKHMLPIDQVAELLNMIEPDKKISFDSQYAEKLYLSYNSKKVCDDGEAIEKLREEFCGKKVLLIAPGKSIVENENKIRAYLNNENVISVNLNHFYFSSNYIFTTRMEMYEEARKRGSNVIVPSNVAVRTGEEERTKIIDYEKWIIVDEKTHDSSGVMSLKLMQALGVSEILLAGFDGFSPNINENYCDITMRKPVTETQAHERNSFYRKLIQQIQKTVPVTFVTPSAYEDR